MDNSLTLIFAQGKMFVGKSEIGSDFIVDCIEVLPMMNADGNYMIIGNVLGTLEVPKECVKVTLSKESIYYRNYYQVTSKVEVVSPKPGFGTGPRRVN